MKRDPFTLPQSLILPMDHDFDALRTALLRIGFSETTPGIRSAGRNPRNASFAMADGLITAHYTFEKPASLGMLHLATTPPALRGWIADAVPWITPSRLPDLLSDRDPRKQLFALWAARADERLELLHDIRNFAAQANGQVRVEATRIADELGDLAQMQLETLAGTQLISQSALPLIAQFQDRDFLQDHLPTAEDCAHLFVPVIANKVADALDQQTWPKRGITAIPTGVEDVFAGPAGLLRWPNSVSDQFPRGYRSVAGGLIPGRIWMGWVGQLPAGGTVRFDGLVFANDRWIFFPKPYRLMLPFYPNLQIATVSAARSI